MKQMTVLVLIFEFSTSYLASGTYAQQLEALICLLIYDRAFVVFYYTMVSTYSYR